MRTINQLTGDTASFTTGKGNWTIDQDGSEPDWISDTSIKLTAADLHTLVITPDANDEPIVLTLSNIPIPISYAESTVQFHCRIKSVQKLDVVVDFTHDQTLPATYQPVRSTSTAFSTWTVCRSNLLPIPNIGTTVFADVEITINDHGQDTIYFTIPFLYGTFDIDASIFSGSTYTLLPRFFIDAETRNVEEGILPEFPTMRFLECGLSAADDAIDLFYDIQYVDTETEGRLPYPTTPSLLAEPAGVSQVTAPWLAQFLGFALDSPQQTTTPWSGLPGTWHQLVTGIDTAATGFSGTTSNLVRSSNVVTATFASVSNITTNDTVSVVAADGTSTSFSGTFVVTGTTGTTITWSQTGTDESATESHNVAELDTSWQEVEDSNPDVLNLAEYTTWQLENAYAGLRSGTYDSIVNAAKFNLTGDKIVTVEKNYASNPWQIRVATKTSETPEGQLGQQSEIILNAILPVRPLGYKLYHICTS